MDELKVLEGSTKEIARTLLVEGEYYINKIDTKVISRIDETVFHAGGFIAKFSNDESPLGVSGEYVYRASEGVIQYELKSKIELFTIRGNIPINDDEKAGEEADLVLEGVLELLFKIYERFTI